MDVELGTRMAMGRFSDKRHEMVLLSRSCQSASPCSAVAMSCYRTVNGNDNPFNLDNTPNYLDWTGTTSFKNHYDFCRRSIAFRRAHPR